PTKFDFNKFNSNKLEPTKFDFNKFNSNKLEPTTKPVAKFSVTPTSGYAPLEVTFEDESTGNPLWKWWGFGDGTGSNSTANKVTHTYTKPGEYTVFLKVTNKAGTSTKTYPVPITVIDGVIDGKSVNKFTTDQNLNVKIKNVDAAEFDKYFEYKNKPAMKSLSSALVSVGNERNINSVFLMALAANEGSWGTSNYASTRNNFFGYGALYEKPYLAWEFSSPTECVDVVAGKIKADYLINPGYKYTILVPTTKAYDEKKRNHMCYPYIQQSVSTGTYYNQEYGATIRGWIVKWNLNSQSEMNTIVTIMNDFASWHFKTYGTQIKTT
ncbi:MAG TPA: PKD domain-containing protein, partial [Methanosarcina sp.]|nr:PKD domain-containing protein [Methanosarcina sp.]